MPHRQHLSDFIEHWCEFLQFPTITAKPEYHKDVRACALWLKNYLSQGGLDVELWDAGAAPTIYAHDLKAGNDKPTVLFYGHYDVQPIDPLSSWHSPPFEPTIRDGKMYARGASDDKGQIFYTLAAVIYYLKTKGSLPVNVKFVIEGEEESGSEGLHTLLSEKKAQLKADHLVIVDCGFEEPEHPVITLGARGIVTFTVTVHEALMDLHSGHCGGLAYNPNRALCQMLAALHDENGRVTVPGFYDDVVLPSLEEKKHYACDFDTGYFKQCFGFEPSGMEKGVDPITANWFSPTLEINGISGGYSGEGFKTVIPASAEAKISCRLVPNQDPQKIADSVIHYLHELLPSKSLRLHILQHAGGGAGFRCPPDSIIATLAARSYEKVFGHPCLKILTGGSIPIIPALAAAAEATPVLIGTSLPTDNIHSPNENFHLESFEKGFQVILQIFDEFNFMN
jgi:acetylornithine deacetylase/succinyl-diaminopimelate desuccinylase-like protein